VLSFFVLRNVNISYGRQFTATLRQCGSAPLYGEQNINDYAKRPASALAGGQQKKLWWLSLLKRLTSRFPSIPQQTLASGSMNAAALKPLGYTPDKDHVLLEEGVCHSFKSGTVFARSAE
jgi:hypothetical protein